MFMITAPCYILERNIFHCHFDYLQNINKTDISRNKKVHYNQMDWTLTTYSHLQPVPQRLILEDISLTAELMKSENEYLLEVNCLPHILHNAIEYTIEKFSFGCKGCVTKVFNYFILIHQSIFKTIKKNSIYRCWICWNIKAYLQNGNHPTKKNKKTKKTFDFLAT